MLQADLAKAGIQLTIRSLEWGELLKRSKAGEHDLSLLGWAGDNGDGQLPQPEPELRRRRVG